MADQAFPEVLYEEEHAAKPVRLTAAGLAGVPLTGLNLVAMADAFLRERWLGGGGAERPLARIGAGRGVVPVIRASGSVWPVNAWRAAEFARALGKLAVRESGGPEAVAEAARLGRAEGVPLWIARRRAEAPRAGRVMVAVDRRLVRADVWAPDAPGAPAVRLRGPYNLAVSQLPRRPPLTVTVAGKRAEVAASWLRWPPGRLWRIVLSAPQGTWCLARIGPRAALEGEGSRIRSSVLTRDGRPVALLTRPPWRERRAARLLPLAAVTHRSADPLDAVVAHFCGVAFGLGNENGTIRFGVTRPLPAPASSAAWAGPWPTGIGTDRPFEWGEGGADDGWGGDGADRFGGDV